MLAALTVRDIVLIEQAALEFAPGLNVLTGETGAGKSILLDSLGLAVGGRGRAGVRPGAAQGSAYDIQRRYDFAYLQCMYAAGERVPMPAGTIDNRPPRYSTPPPPPPPGYRY